MSEFDNKITIIAISPVKQSNVKNWEKIFDAELNFFDYQAYFKASAAAKTMRTN